MPAPDLIASLQRQFPGKVGQGKEFRGEHTVEVDREIIRSVAGYLKNELGLSLVECLGLCFTAIFGDGTIDFEKKLAQPVPSRPKDS